MKTRASSGRAWPHLITLGQQPHLAIFSLSTELPENSEPHGNILLAVRTRQLFTVLPGAGGEVYPGWGVPGVYQG